jgi:hypothetical protein
VHGAATLFSVGGIGFRGTGHDKYFDTITLVSGTQPQVARVLATYGRPPVGTMVALGGHQHGDGGAGERDAAFVQALIALQSDGDADWWFAQNRKHR